MNLDNVIQAMRQLPPSATLADIEQCLPQSISAVQEILVDLHQALMCADLSKMASKSKETATHFVWVIADNPTVDSKLCLHQFKSSSEATAGYANTIHNHRYDFASLVLNGGYTEEVYNLDLTKLEVNSIVSLPRPAETRVNVGQVTVVDHARFHHVVHLLPATLTLVIKAPPQMERSLSVNVETGVVSAHYSLNERVRRLIDTVEHAAETSL